MPNWWGNIKPHLPIVREDRNSPKVKFGLEGGKKSLDRLIANFYKTIRSKPDQAVLGWNYAKPKQFEAGKPNAPYGLSQSITTNAITLHGYKTEGGAAESFLVSSPSRLCLCFEKSVKAADVRNAINAGSSSLPPDATQAILADMKLVGIGIFDAGASLTASLPLTNNYEIAESGFTALVVDSNICWRYGGQEKLSPHETPFGKYGGDYYMELTNPTKVVLIFKDD